MTNQSQMVAMAIAASFLAAVAQAQDRERAPDPAPAEETGASEGTPSADEGAPARPDGSESRARALFEAGAAAIEEGDFESAHRHFVESFALSDRPRLLFNIASTAERLRRDEEALEHYRLFLEREPETPNRRFVEGRIEALEAAVAEGVEPAPPPEEQPVAEVATPASEDGGDPAMAGWVLTGAGLAVAAGGAVVLGLGAAERSRVDGAERGAAWQEFESAHAMANTLAPLGAVLLGAGAAMSVVGIVIAATAGSDDEALAVMVAPGRIELRGSW